MSTNNKILGQAKPAAITPIVVYTVPGSTQANVNLFAANQNATTDDSIWVALVKSGNTIDDTCYILYGVSVKKGLAENITGIALAAGDFIVVRSLNGDVSFNATGIEIS